MPEILEISQLANTQPKETFSIGYVYAISISSRIIYIGHTKNPLSRWQIHISNALNKNITTNRNLYYTLNYLIFHGIYPRFKIIYIGTYEKSLEVERAFIAKYSCKLFANMRSSSNFNRIDRIIHNKKMHNDTRKALRNLLMTDFKRQLNFFNNSKQIAA